MSTSPSVIPSIGKQGMQNQQLSFQLKQQALQNSKLQEQLQTALQQGQLRSHTGGDDVTSPQSLQTPMTSVQKLQELVILSLYF
jgi:hypothetical protein